MPLWCRCVLQHRPLYLVPKPALVLWWPHNSSGTYSHTRMRWLPQGCGGNIALCKLALNSIQDG